MNHLLRSHAPLSESAWELIDGEARSRVTPALAARRLIDLKGPHGWEHSAVGLGRTAALPAGPVEGVHARRRRVLALLELRADFTVSREELQDADRGADDVDLGDLDHAARRIATAENVCILRGWPEAVEGIAQAATGEPIALGGPDSFAQRIADAAELLLSRGIAGPYGLALGPSEYRLAVGAEARGGQPIQSHLREIVDGPIVWSPGIEGGVLLSQRGGDFDLQLGQDLAVGYAGHDEAVVRLYLQESLAFKVDTPEAAVMLAP